MKIAGPERYKLSFDANRFTVKCAKGTTKFSGIATTKLPKLYVISVEGRPIYVGVTRQSMSRRLHIGFNAAGENGYHVMLGGTKQVRPRWTFGVSLIRPQIIPS